MQTPTHWREEFQTRVQRGANGPVSFDMNRLVEELASDIQDDALGLPPQERPNYGIISRSEAEDMAVKAKQ